MEKLKALPGRILLVGGNLQESLEEAKSAKTVDAARAAIEQALRELDVILMAANRGKCRS